MGVFPMQADYLQATEIIDWQHPEVLTLAQTLAEGQKGATAIAQVSFEWVRDQIRHSSDHQLNPVTYRASDVLLRRTGYCFAKSHLLAALLRAHGIPTGFSYQRLSIDDQGPPYSLHGLNAVYLPDWGWYRIDARGNKLGVNAQFTPPIEQLAYAIRLPGEIDSPQIFSNPLPIVIEALQVHTTWDQLLQNLPDLPSLNTQAMDGGDHPSPNPVIACHS